MGIFGSETLPKIPKPLISPPSRFGLAQGGIENTGFLSKFFLIHLDPFHGCQIIRDPFH